MTPDNINPSLSLYMAAAAQYCVWLQVAAEKSRGNLSGAIELLRKYVDVYMLDKAAWEELYLQVEWQLTCILG